MLYIYIDTYIIYIYIYIHIHIQIQIQIYHKANSYIGVIFTNLANDEKEAPPFRGSIKGTTGIFHGNDTWRIGGGTPISGNLHTLRYICVSTYIYIYNQMIYLYMNNYIYIHSFKIDTSDISLPRQMKKQNLQAKLHSGWGLKFLRFESLEQMEKGRILHAVGTTAYVLLGKVVEVINYTGSFGNFAMKTMGIL